MQGDEVDEFQRDADADAEQLVRRWRSWARRRPRPGRSPDDDERGLELSQTSVTVTEDTLGDADGEVHGGAADATDGSGGGGSEIGCDCNGLTVSAATRRITTTNWNTAQTVTVSAVDDDAIDNTGDQRSATVTHTASGGDYGAQSKNVAVTVSDDDAVNDGVTLSVSLTQVAENVTSAPTVTVTAAVNGTTQVRRREDGSGGGGRIGRTA